MECHLSECASEANSIVSLQRLGQLLPQEGLLPLIPGDGMRPPANLIYEVCTGSVDGAQGLKGYGNERVTVHNCSIFLQFFGSCNFCSRTRSGARCDDVTCC